MKLAEAFAKRTYRARDIPDTITDEAWAKMMEQLNAAMETYIIYSYYGVWEAQRDGVVNHGEDWKDYFEEEEHATNFPAYLKDVVHESMADDFLDFRGDAEEIVARIRKRFE
jgi:hypothetical protein